jgi:NADPH:quinone reductase-like Zn-dependent oxidoreductase
MRALVLERHGAPFTLTEIALPEVTKGQVLVRIKASGVNPLDTKIRAGNAPHARVKLPAVLGMDLAGVVERVGAGVAAFKPGDEVYGMAGGVGGLQGTLVSPITSKPATRGRIKTSHSEVLNSYQIS